MRRAVLVLVVLAGAALGLYGLRTPLKRLAYEEPGRDRWQRPSEVLEELAIAPGATVADLGSGGGYFALRLATAVGAEGTVYAVDVDRGLNRYLERRARELGLEQLHVIEASADDPRIPEPVDLLFSCNTVHHLEDVEGYFRRVRGSVRQDGRVVLIDYRDRHRSLPAAELAARMRRAGFELERELDLLPRQYFLVFRPSGGEAGGERRQPSRPGLSG